MVATASAGATTLLSPSASLCPCFNPEDTTYTCHKDNMAKTGHQAPMGADWTLASCHFPWKVRGIQVGIRREFCNFPWKGWRSPPWVSQTPPLCFSRSWPGWGGGGGWGRDATSPNRSCHPGAGMTQGPALGWNSGSGKAAEQPQLKPSCHKDSTGGKAKRRDVLWQWHATRGGSCHLDKGRQGRLWKRGREQTPDTREPLLAQDGGVSQEESRDAQRAAEQAPAGWARRPAATGSHRP